MTDEEAGRPRRFSRRECARLQGFPEEFSYEAAEGPRAWYRAIGNAVSPPVVCAIAGAILCAWRHGDRQCSCPGTRAALTLAVRSCDPRARDALLSREVREPTGESAGLMLSEALTALDPAVGGVLSNCSTTVPSTRRAPLLTSCSLGACFPCLPFSR